MPEPVFPAPLPQGSAYHQLVERALNNDIIHGRLLSADGRLALIILSLEPSTVDGGHLESIVNDVRQAMAEDLQGTDLTAELTGVPVMQLEIRHALERDRILYNAVGFALGCVIAALFFRRLTLMIVALARRCSPSFLRSAPSAGSGSASNHVPRLVFLGIPTVHRLRIHFHRPLGDDLCQGAQRRSRGHLRNRGVRPCSRWARSRAALPQSALRAQRS